MGDELPRFDTPVQPLSTIVACTERFTYDAKVWACPSKEIGRFATLASLHLLIHPAPRPHTPQGSIMNKSNTGGAGRGGVKGSIIGDVINHGKKRYWAPGQSYHYHCTLDAGENTLEAQLVVQLLASVVATGGSFQPDHFRDTYVNWMTTPGSHNDAYARWVDGF